MRLILAGGVAVALALSAPIHGESASSPRDAATFLAPVTDTVWYFTNREHDEDDDWRRARASITRGLHSYAVAPLRADPVTFEVRLDVRPVDGVRLDSAAMHAALRQAVETSSDGAVVLHVHGYATSMREATEEAAEMRQRGAFDGPVAVFAWPANDIGMTWPAARRLFTNAYWQDSAAAAESAPDLAGVVHELVDLVGADRVVLSAHSMGNQLLAAALMDSALRVRLAHTPLRAVAFVSPDLDREYFRDTVVPAASPLARRLVLYGARDDLMLRLSAALHEGRPRAGLLRAADRWPAALEVVDITGGRAAATWFGPWVDTNHAFRRQGTALVDLFAVVVPGAPAACRSALGIMERDTTGAWLATDAPLPLRPWMRADAEPALVPGDCIRPTALTP